MADPLLYSGRMVFNFRSFYCRLGGTAPLPDFRRAHKNSSFAALGFLAVGGKLLDYSKSVMMEWDAKGSAKQPELF